MTQGLVQLGGLASGLDTQSIIQKLVQAESAGLSQMQSRQAQDDTAKATLTSIGTALGSLSTAAAALASLTSVTGLTATSSSTAIAASADGTATAGSYDVQVDQLATEQRTYSATFATSDAALSQSGTLSIAIGAGAATNITIGSSDSLSDVAAKINAAGIRASASVFYDGSAYRLQVRGLDTGAANALTFTEQGTSLDLAGTGATATSGKTVQVAADAKVEIDGFTVTRPTNQITGAIQGVTLALTQKTTSPVTIGVASDPSTVTTKLQAVVSNYNTVIKAVHGAAGWGTAKAQDPLLAGDSDLRSVTDKLQGAITTLFGGSGQFTLLSQIGLTQAEDGTLALDTSKLSDAMTKDAASVQKLLGRASGATSGGAMATLQAVVDDMNAPTTGLLALREQAFTDDSTQLGDRITNEQARIDSYQKQLQASFTAMETAYSQSQSLLSQVQKIGA